MNDRNRRIFVLVATLALGPGLVGSAFATTEGCLTAVAMATETYVSEVYETQLACPPLEPCEASQAAQERGGETLRTIVDFGCDDEDVAAVQAASCAGRTETVTELSDCLIERVRETALFLHARNYGRIAPPTPTPRPQALVVPTPSPPPCQPNLGGPCQSGDFGRCCSRRLSCGIDSAGASTCGFPPSVR